MRYSTTSLRGAEAGTSPETSGKMPFTRRSWGLLSLQIILASVSSSCGTVLYPERRGQPRGRLDWGVVLLNGLGLLFFFIPGVIAFAVDFATGAIYLPSDYVPCEPTPTSNSNSKRTSKLEKFSIPRSELNPRGIEKAVAERTGKTISLDDRDLVSQELESIDEFWKTRDLLDRHSLGTKVGIS